MKSLCLQSARMSVAVMLAGALPAAAQSYGHTPQVSTPAERVQTQQLNDQAIDGTTQPPAALNGEAAPQQMAQSDQQTYEDQQQQYQQQRAQYHEERRQYVRDVRRYDLARYEWSDYPRVYVYRYEAPNLQRLYLIADPTHLPLRCRWRDHQAASSEKFATWKQHRMDALGGWRSRSTAWYLCG